MGRSGERGSGISVPAARHDDDDNDIKRMVARKGQNTELQIKQEDNEKFNNYISKQETNKRFLIFVLSGNNQQIFHCSENTNFYFHFFISYFHNRILLYFSQIFRYSIRIQEIKLEIA